MSFNLQTLEGAIDLNDKSLVASLCDELVKEIYHQPDQYDIAVLEKIMKDLRAKRMFPSMVKIGDASLQNGKASLKIRRQFAQALIEEKLFTAALQVLNDISRDLKDMTDALSVFERNEALGLTGRVYKQLYVTANNPDHPYAKEFIKNAINAYMQVYRIDPSVYLWHGINAVAMAARATSDGIEVPGIDIKSISQNILQTISEREATEKSDAFDLATAVEACIALQQPKEAIAWLNKYIQWPQADAFEFASTLRQFTEVWQLEKDNAELQQIIPILRGALLKKEGGTVTINAAEIRDGVYNKDEMPVKAEKVFGPESYQSYEWYMKGAQRCLMIARIGREKSKGFGTGFLMDGADLHKDLSGELVLLTNAHVVSDDVNDREALRPEEALIIFEVLGLAKTYAVDKLYFTSPFKRYDVSILRFSKKDSRELKDELAKKGVELFKISSRELKKEANERMYIIGHPAGGTLQLSLQDNALLDYDNRLLHYRTPTVGGSSGSPVFDDNWNLVGIHHAGGNYIRKLNDVRGMYQANEGIRINAIINALKEKV